jgi:hypothetical protein
LLVTGDCQVFVDFAGTPLSGRISLWPCLHHVCVTITLGGIRGGDEPTSGKGSYEV